MPSTLHPEEEEKERLERLPLPPSCLCLHITTPATDFLSCTFDNWESQPVNVTVNEEFEIEIWQGVPFFTWGGGSWIAEGVLLFIPQDVRFQHHSLPASSPLLLPH